MFLLNIGYVWANHEKADGIIINASGVHKAQATRRNLQNHPKMLLFDPQLYLAGLDCELCNMTCSRLSTYPWFGGSKVEFDSSVITQKDWFNQHREIMVWPFELSTSRDEIADCIRSCFDYQMQLGVTHLIIPVPLIEDPENEVETQLIWIDTAIELKEEYDLPMLASIAFVDQLLIHQSPMNNKLALSIMDNITARIELDGIYIVPVQLSENSLKLDNKKVGEFLLHMSSIMGYNNEKIVVVNFTDSFGYACLGVGATAFGGGYTNKTKRMNLNDFVESTGGGPAYPRFYSHNLILDLLPNRDLTKIMEEKLLRLIRNDVTNSSEDLLETLRQGSSPNTLPTWREGKNNVSAATAHRIELLKNMSENIAGIEDIEDKENYILEWLQNAEANNLLLQSRFVSEPLNDDGRHIAVWRIAFADYLNNK